MMLHTRPEPLVLLNPALVAANLSGLSGLGSDPGSVDPTTGILNAGCIGCVEGPAAGGEGGSGTPTAEQIEAGCDPSLTAQGYTCQWDQEHGYRYFHPTVTQTPGTTPGTTPGSGSGPQTPGGTQAGVGSGNGPGQTPNPGGTPFKPSTLVWVLLGSIAVLGTANVVRARR